MLADTEFGTVGFLHAVRKRSWRAVVGMRCNRRMQDGRTLKQLYRQGRRGQQVHLVGMTNPVTVSWFWLKRADCKRELRFVVSTHPYSGVHLLRLGRKRWAIEGFFKTITPSLWAASLRANYETWCLSLAHPVPNCLSISALD